MMHYLKRFMGVGGIAVVLAVGACAEKSQPGAGNAPTAAAGAANSEVPPGNEKHRLDSKTSQVGGTPQEQGAQAVSQGKSEVATFGAGCFWGVEYVLRQQPGVIDAVSGYAGGSVANPTYKQVCYEDTGHAEVVQVTFDPAKISYEQLVNIFFRLHDPTQSDGQGPDIGDQYRSVIFSHSPEQERIARQVKAARQASGKYPKPIVTSIEAFRAFYKAEEYHQKYYEKTGKEPYCHVLRPE